MDDKQYVERSSGPSATVRLKLGEIMQTTEQILIGMLTENTGSHFLDSGGFYGHNYDQNAKVTDWDKRPDVNVDVFEDTFSLTIDVYQFLKNALDTDKTTERLNQVFSRFSDRNREPWPDVLESFCKWLHWDQSDIQGENSYNCECALSQTIQFWTYEDFCILQIHGGCDVRGGYTKPVFFRLCEDHSIWDFARITAIVEPKVKYDPGQAELMLDLPRNGGTFLDTDDGGYSWNEDGSYSQETVKLFEVIDGRILWDGRSVVFYI